MCFGRVWDDLDLIAAAYRWLIRHVAERDGESPSPLIIEDSGAIRDDAEYRLTYQDLVLAATRLHSMTQLSMKASDRCEGRVRCGKGRDLYKMWLGDRHVFNAAWSPTDGEYVIVSPSDDAPECHGAGFIGSISMNMGGTEFVVYDAGYVSRSGAGRSPMIPVHGRVALARVVYETNLLVTAPHHGPDRQ